MKITHISKWLEENTLLSPLHLGNIRVPRVELDNSTTYLDKDGSNNLTLTDAVTGTKTLAQLSAAGAGDLKANGTVPLTANWDVGAFKVTAAQLESDVAAGTAPLVVASNTAVTNLNADTVDGSHAAAFEASGAAATHSALTTGVHGVGAGTVAKTADITATKIDALTAGDDNTTLDSNTTRHGLLLKAVVPAASLMNVPGIVFGETVFTNKPVFDATNPAALGAVAPGTAVTASHRDHVHANPALDTLAAPTDNTTRDATTSLHGLVVKATDPGTANFINVVGLANADTAYTNKPLFDATVPSTQAIADAAAAGTATVSARRDHKHAMPSQATMDTASVAAIAAAGFTLADAKFITFTDPSASHTFSGFVKSHKAHETLVFGDVCFINGDEEMALAKGDAIATMPAVCICVATAGIAANASGLFMFWGFIHDDTFAFAHTGGAANQVWVSAATAGLASTTCPSGSVNVVQSIGHVLATDELFFQCDKVYLELVA